MYHKMRKSALSNVLITNSQTHKVVVALTLREFCLKY